MIFFPLINAWQSNIIVSFLAAEMKWSQTNIGSSATLFFPWALVEGLFFFFFLSVWTVLPEHVQNWFSFKVSLRTQHVVVFLFLGLQRSCFIISIVSVSGWYSSYSFVGNPVSSLALVSVLSVSKLMFYPHKHFQLSATCWKHFFFSASVFYFTKNWFLTIQTACIHTLNSEVTFIYFVHTIASLLISRDQIPQFSLNPKGF